MTYHALPLITACSIAVSVVRLRQNHVSNLDFPLDKLLLGLFVGVASKPDAVDSTASCEPCSDEGVWRPVAELCADLVCHIPGLLPIVRGVIGHHQLKETFAACLTARIPNLIDSFVACSWYVPYSAHQQLTQLPWFDSKLFAALLLNSDLYWQRVISWTPFKLRCFIVLYWIEFELVI